MHSLRVTSEVQKIKNFLEYGYCLRCIAVKPHIFFRFNNPIDRDDFKQKRNSCYARQLEECASVSIPDGVICYRVMCVEGVPSGAVPVEGNKNFLLVPGKPKERYQVFGQTVFKHTVYGNINNST